MVKTLNGESIVTNNTFVGKERTRDEIKEKKNKTEYRLIDLLEQIQKIDGIERIRLGSLEPTLITEEFVTRLSKLSKICDHFHLSLQSGCNETLKRMNRKYSTENSTMPT